MNTPEQETSETGSGPPQEESPEALRALAEAQAEQHRADWLRAVAELDNVRKRTAREIEQVRQFGVERFASDLLPALDSLALAIEAAPGADSATLLEGERATQRLLLKAFERAGIAELDPAGQPFDPALHEAMVTQPSAGHPANTVLQVIQKGYLLNGRLLRPARVIVSIAPPEGPGPAPDG